jgi:G3E family GTPase
MADIPVTMVGGYLGAGKTTLINHVLTGSHGLRIAVLVNDFGAINIDASLIADASDDTISLTNGCVCCSIHDDLGAALDLQTRRTSPPDHILIETSGVAEPARILTYATGWPGVRLDAVVTLVDAETIRARADDKFVGRVVQRQLAVADFLVVNKLDLVTEVDRHGISRWLTERAPSARLIETIQANIDPALLFEAARPQAQNTVIEGGRNGRHSAEFSSAMIELPWPVDIEVLTRALGGLSATIHRVKGFVTDRASGQRMLVQRVGNRQTVTPTADYLANNAILALVAIGTDEIDLRDFAEALAAMACTS